VGVGEDYSEFLICKVVMFAVRQISVCEQRNAAVVEMVLEEGRSLLSQNDFVRAGVVFSAGAS